MGNAALGRVGLALESSTNPGMVLLLAATAVSSLPASLTTQPNGVTGQSIWSGMRLCIEVRGNTATGTITVTGKDFTQAQNALAETTNTIPVSGTGANQGPYYPYTTKAVFSTINASGVTVSGLTGGTVTIWGIQAARFDTPAMLEVPEEKKPPFSPQEQRGTMSRNTNIQKLNTQVDVPGYKTTFLPDTDALWFGRATIGNAPTQGFLPANASALALKASAAVSGGPFSLTTQPNVLGAYAQLQFVVTGSSVIGTIVVAGVNNLGVSVSETVQANGTNGNGTYTSVNFYQTVNASGVSFTGLTSGSCAINGLYPTQLKALTAVSALPASLTTQPNTIGPDSILQITVSASAANGTIGIAGTNRYGQSISETVVCGIPGSTTGQGTFYTQQAFASVSSNGVTLGGGLGSGSIAINGIIGLQETYSVGAAGAGAGDTLQTLTFEQYTGTDALAHPFTYFDETTIEGSPEKELMISGKGMAQDQLVIGDPTVTPMTNITGNIPFGVIGLPGNFWQPFDIGVSGWAARFWIDALSGTAGTTAYNQVLDYKITFKNPRKPSWPTINNPRYQVVYRQQREVQIDCTIDFIDVVQYKNFEANVKQLVQFQIDSNYLLGTISSSPVNKNWIFVFAAKLISAKRDTSKMEKVEAKISFLTEYTPTLGYEYTLVTQNQATPNYAS
jgi:hypothetical protein